MTSAPSLMSPVATGREVIPGLPTHSGGRKGAGDAFRITTRFDHPSSVRLFITRRTGLRMICDHRQRATSSPARTFGPTSCSWNSNEVTTPKITAAYREWPSKIRFFQPAPRIDQLPIGRHQIRRDHVVDGHAVLAGQPLKPPPSISPAMPVMELTPTGSASAWACARGRYRLTTRRVRCARSSFWDRYEPTACATDRA